MKKSKFLSSIYLNYLLKIIGSLLIIIVIFQWDLSRGNIKNPGLLLINEYLDRQMFISILAVSFFNILINLLTTLYKRGHEDQEKVITSLKDCQKFQDTYQLNLDEIMKIDELDGINPAKNKYKFTIFPGVILYQKSSLTEKTHFSIDDSQNFFQLPKYVENHYNELMAAHAYSKTFSNINIRLKDITISDNKITLFTERTTFFNSLVTNRATEKILSTGFSLKNILEPGPILTPLNQAQMSNHIGFNLFVITSDNKVIFVKRSKHLSIGKNSIGPSVAAGMKGKYAIDQNGGMNLASFSKGFTGEINDELKLSLDQFDFSLEENIFCIYRDLVEVGKPQFVGYVKAKQNFIDIETHFKAKLKEAEQNKDFDKKLITDGKKLLAVDMTMLADSFEKIKVKKGRQIIIVNGKKWKISPTLATALRLFMPYLGELNNENN